jgi:hypothetical protein
MNLYEQYLQAQEKAASELERWNKLKSKLDEYVTKRYEGYGESYREQKKREMDYVRAYGILTGYTDLTLFDLNYYKGEENIRVYEPYTPYSRQQLTQFQYLFMELNSIFEFFPYKTKWVEAVKQGRYEAGLDEYTTWFKTNKTPQQAIEDWESILQETHHNTGKKITTSIDIVNCEEYDLKDVLIICREKPY